MTWAWLAWLPQGLQAALGIQEKIQTAVELKKAADASTKADAANLDADTKAGRDRDNL